MSEVSSEEMSSALDALDDDFDVGEALESSNVERTEMSSEEMSSVLDVSKKVYLIH